MIRRPLQPAETFYRMHSPRWAYAPTSGAGAAKAGGRFNRQGVPALYLSHEVATAAAEFQQTSILLPPGTLVAYKVALTSIVDFSGGYSAKQWDPLWSDWDCNWRQLLVEEHTEPPSWLLGDMAIEAGAKGILFPSMMANDGHNLVIFTDLLELEDELQHYDPNNDLPNNQNSWNT
jgi:RES domain-containing protein